jgi:hypothetical protein
MGGIGQLLQTLAGVIPHRVLVPLLAVVLVALTPAWLRWLRIKQVRGHLRAATRRRTAIERQPHVDAAFRRAGTDLHALVALADDALRLDVPGVFTRALEAIERNPSGGRELARLRHKALPEQPRYTNPIEAAVSISRLVETGMLDEAHARLTVVMTRFQDDPDLLEVEARLREARSVV